LRALIRAFGAPDRIYRAGRHALSGAVGPSLADAILASEDAPHADVEAALEWAAGAPDRHIVGVDEPSYPSRLANISDPPFVLFARGRIELLGRPSIAVVGSRNPTAQGRDHARAFGRAMAGAGLTVVSGLALGIDAEAHAGALDRPASTIAILGTGIDVPYPRANAELFARIATEGLLLSEMPLGQAPLPHNFPKRNRIISGMTLGCLVVEASLSSGSLITARMAADQGREVFAIPGSVHSPVSRGCHALIKQGAKLVESAQDVLEEFQHQATAELPLPGSGSAPLRPPSPLLESMGFDPIHLDILCSRLGLTPDVVSAMLLELELEGRVAALPGGRYQRRQHGD